MKTVSSLLLFLTLATDARPEAFHHDVSQGTLREHNKRGSTSGLGVTGTQKNLRGNRGRPQKNVNNEAVHRATEEEHNSGRVHRKTTNDPEPGEDHETGSDDGTAAGGETGVVEPVFETGLDNVSALTEGSKPVYMKIPHMLGIQNRWVYIINANHGSNGQVQEVNPGKFGKEQNYFGSFGGGQGSAQGGNAQGVTSVSGGQQSSLEAGAGSLGQEHNQPSSEGFSFSTNGNNSDQSVTSVAGVGGNMGNLIGGNSNSNTEGKETFTPNVSNSNTAGKGTASSNGSVAAVGVGGSTVSSVVAETSNQQGGGGSSSSSNGQQGQGMVSMENVGGNIMGGLTAASWSGNGNGNGNWNENGSFSSSSSSSSASPNGNTPSQQSGHNQASGLEVTSVQGDVTMGSLQAAKPSANGPSLNTHSAAWSSSSSSESSSASVILQQGNNFQNQGEQFAQHFNNGSGGNNGQGNP
eukprot:CAMPEP_0195517100 /NCGR_PEP_ID=MMETSP0794_2-20130614/9684_1 /TAXON_ID=515487 /ORGANISM="Stephanopyxis turris, Strain CCMP 815" /LENGTH=465 /DNA_ID=CAMNT_0040645851 /DNA_START=135 /DNA_END=1532 /DNA_ORIENTATION=+